jgi:hypothetical protein
MRTSLLLCVFLAACKDGSTAATDAATSASATSSAAPQAVDFDSHGKWWAVAAKSHTYTNERRTDADNALRMLPDPAKTKVRRALDDMATQTHDADGLNAAAQVARNGQDAVEDVHNPAARNAMTGGAWIVLSGLVASACAEHPDMASLNDLMAEIRTMQLPHLDKGNGNPERLLLEQEMKASVDDKTMKAVLAAAPPPKKSF